MLVTLRHCYDAPPERVWDLVTSYSIMHEVCRPHLTFDSVPTRDRITAGDVVTFRVRFVGLFPVGRHTMRVVACDPERLSYALAERGETVARWNHTVSLTPTGFGTRLDETIDIDVGFFTPIYAVWARLFYNHRHRRRLAILARDLEAPSGAP